MGLWQPEARRFPHGLPYIMEYIRNRGMVPGLWLELEVMGGKMPSGQAVAGPVLLYAQRQTGH